MFAFRKSSAVLAGLFLFLAMPGYASTAEGRAAALASVKDGVPEHWDDVTQDQLELAVASTESKDASIKEWSDGVLALFDATNSETLSMSPAAFPPRKDWLDRLSKWSSSGSPAEKKLAARSMTWMLSNPAAMDPWLQDMDLALLVQYGSKVLAAARPWSPRSFYLAELLWKFGGGPGKDAVLKSELGTYFALREKGIDRVPYSETGAISNACLDPDKLRALVGAAADPPKAFVGNDDGKRWIKDWPTLAQSSCAPLISPEHNDVVVCYRHDTLNYTGPQTIKVWRGSDRKIVFELELGMLAGANVTVVQGKYLLHTSESDEDDETMSGCECEEAEEYLYAWTDKGFKRVFEAGPGGREVAGSGPMGVWEEHHIAYVDGAAALVTTLSDAGFENEFEMSKEWPEGDVRVLVEPLLWNEKTMRVELGPPKRYFQEQIFREPFRFANVPLWRK
jgi:hypothetical protein